MQGEARPCSKDLRTFDSDIRFRTLYCPRKLVLEIKYERTINPWQLFYRGMRCATQQGDDRYRLVRPVKLTEYFRKLDVKP
jgi:hypothetical protein